jgi:HTH-type transcriptional regulator, transcriptional repressor of NAD biosynthesis genes
MAKRGLVIGKFYPPHRGHKYLIDTAQSQVDELTVLVCDKAGQVPPASLRASWLREIHPRAKVVVIEDIGHDDDSQIWADYTRRILGYAPDVVFTSEDYGETYARLMGSEHVTVDKARLAVPISGTRVRENPLGCWDFLEPPVRAYYVKRVVLVGAESTGKTTLAGALAEHYRTVWVPEWARDYTYIKVERGDFETWTPDEFVLIANEQSALEDRLARKANRVLICDTDAFATTIWHRRYVGERHPGVEAIAAPRKYDLYLLPDIKTPFVQDGVRDGEHIREWMHGVFVEELERQGKPYAHIAGTHEQRMAQATGLIDKLLEG